MVRNRVILPGPHRAGRRVRPSLSVIIGIISFFAWAGIARIVRGQTLSLKEKEYIEAARSLGAGPGVDWNTTPPRQVTADDFIREFKEGPVPQTATAPGLAHAHGRPLG
jgi:hypothetical protein